MEILSWIKRGAPLKRYRGGDLGLADDAGGSRGAIADFLETLRRLQKIFGRLATNAARNATRLTTLSGDAVNLNRDVADVMRLANDLRGGIQNIARVSAETAESATKMSGVLELSRKESSETVASAKNLKTHMNDTFGRINDLMNKVDSINKISVAVQGIATESKLLSFNASLEAARAGEAGQGFRVVAEQMQKLANITAEQTQQIFSVLSSINADLEPSRKAILNSRDLAQSTSEQVTQMLATFENIATLIQSTTNNMASISEAVGNQKNAVDIIFDKIDSATGVCERVESETSKVLGEALKLSEQVEIAYAEFGRYDTGSTFHRILNLSRELVRRSEEHFEVLIDQGKLTLNDVLRLDYQEFKGADIQRLSRLFNVSRVPATGFDPPKYFTAYDEAVDLGLQAIMDEVKAQEPKLTFALVVDLNSYGPIHNKEFCKDWTGDKAKDLAGNRIKRFFLENRILVRGARVGLNQRAVNLPDKSSRGAFEQVAGAELRRSTERSENFLVQTYMRDTGAVMTVLTVPIHVKNQRYGAVLLGWSESE